MKLLYIQDSIGTTRCSQISFIINNKVLILTTSDPLCSWKNVSRVYQNQGFFHQWATSDFWCKIAFPRTEKRVESVEESWAVKNLNVWTRWVNRFHSKLHMQYSTLIHIAYNCYYLFHSPLKHDIPSHSISQAQKEFTAKDNGTVGRNHKLSHKTGFSTGREITTHSQF
jgi:hypothetical protein